MIQTTFVSLFTLLLHCSVTATPIYSRQNAPTKYGFLSVTSPDFQTGQFVTSVLDPQGLPKLTSDFDTILSLTVTSAPLGQWYMQGNVAGEYQYLVADAQGNIAAGTGYLDGNKDVHITKNTDLNSPPNSFSEAGVWVIDPQTNEVSINYYDVNRKVFVPAVICTMEDATTGVAHLRVTNPGGYQFCDGEPTTLLFVSTPNPNPSQ